MASLRFSQHNPKACGDELVGEPLLPDFRLSLDDLFTYPTGLTD